MSEKTTHKNHFWRVFFKTLNKWLTAICIVSIIFVILMDTDTLAVEKPLKLFVAFGKFFYGIAISYIAAYVFYLITVHYGETKTAINIYTAAEFPASAIVTNVYSIFLDMAKNQGHKLNRKDLSEIKIKEILSATKCYGESNLHSSFGDTPKYNWIEYLEIKNSTIKSFYEKFNSLYYKLDGEYIGALSDLEQVDFWESLKNCIYVALNLNIVNRNNLYFKDGWEEFLIDLFGKAQQLEAVIEKRRELYEIKKKSIESKPTP